MINLQSNEEIERQIQEYKDKKRLLHKGLAKKQRAKDGFCSRCGSVNVEYKNYKSCRNCRIQSNNKYHEK